ncbi:MAG: type II toxin-antitoxin system PemK/MazF family toxin [Candidatus Desantisbacteria bacterium]
MVTPTAKAVVLVPFPFSDLSQSKLRPAVVLAAVGQGDWILCQITSKSYGDAQAVGSLCVRSYARPGKIFTANHSLMLAKIGDLKPAVFKQIIEKIVTILQANL